MPRNHPLLLLALIGVQAANVTSEGTKHCTARGGCDCDCSWATSSTCNHDDGSCCWGCCCSTPSPPTPPTPPSPSSSFCPSADDIVTTYGSPQIQNQGWTIQGNGGVATKSAFNLLGGSVEFDIDFSSTNTGINANIKTISPDGNGSNYTADHYCDGADNDKPWCLEVDWIESNGNCGGATTLHTIQGPGPNGCTSWGCRASYHYNGKASFHVRVEYGTDGTWTTIRDGQTIDAGTLSPHPGSSDVATIAASYQQKGAVIVSTEWQGWVPVQDCGTKGDLDSSKFSVSNLVIEGSVVQGPTPQACGNATFYV